MSRYLPWVKLETDRSTGRTWESINYLVPSLNPLDLKADKEQDGVPENLSTDSPDTDFQEPKAVYLNRAQLFESWPQTDFENWVSINVEPGSREATLKATSFTLIKQRISGRADFALHQTGLALCRAALRAGGLGVIDRPAQRFFSPVALQKTSKEKFDIEDHIGIRVEKGLCQTKGLSEKFGASDYAIRVSSPHHLGVAVHLLNEIANQVANGKHYGEKSLFRKRTGAHVCQLLFRPLDPESDFSIFEAVDMVMEQRVIKPSVNADGALEYFTQGDPNWNAIFGWPPREFPSQTSSANSANLFGLIPGISESKEALEILGPPSGRTVEPQRWLFSHEAWDNPLRLEIYQELGVVKRLLSTGLAIDNTLFTDRSTYPEVQKVLGTEALSRQFVAPPDRSLARTERVWALPHPTQEGQTLLIALTFDQSEKLWQSELQTLAESPQAVVQSLGPSYGRELLTGFVPKFPAKRTKLSPAAQRIRVFLESSAQMIRQLLIQFGKREWLDGSLDSYAMTAGAYLLNDGIPKRELLEEIGLPANIFLNAFEALELFLEHPTTKIRTAKAEEKGISEKELGIFTWLLQNIKDTAESDLSLAVDLAQVFRQYRLQLETILKE